LGRTLAYCRVSSRDQNPQLQLDALHAHGYDQLFAEKESGKHGVQRPEFSRGLAALQAGDTPVFWKSDRWGRSAAHVLTTVGELRDRGVTVKSLTENFDLDIKEGRFMFAVLAAAAEYELELRAERQAEGIDRRRVAPPGRRDDAARQETHRPAPGDRSSRACRAAPADSRRHLCGWPGWSERSSRSSNRWPCSQSPGPARHGSPEAPGVLGRQNSIHAGTRLPPEPLRSQAHQGIRPNRPGTGLALGTLRATAALDDLARGLGLPAGSTATNCAPTCGPEPNAPNAKPTPIATK
jgi:Resolvase, N terminal domain